MPSGQYDRINRPETIGESWRRRYREATAADREAAQKLRRKERAARPDVKQKAKENAARRKLDPAKVAMDRMTARVRGRRKYKQDPARYCFHALKYRLGVDAAQYNEMLSRQSGVCAICGRPEKNGRRLAVDHNHETGAIRELLCNACNVGLGNYRDDATLLLAAVNYLRKHQSTEEGQCQLVEQTA